MKKKVVIVGGVAGGASAATRLRRLDEEADIVLLERGGYISFANCGLPYYIGGAIQERGKLLVQTPERMMQRFNLDVRVNSEVTRVNADRRTVTVRTADGEYEEPYDRLILSPGAAPLVPPIPGVRSDRVFTVRNIPDTDKIKAKTDEPGIRSAVVIGGGFIGAEMAEALRERGLDVTLVEAAPHILAPLDSDMVPIAEKVLTDHGVRLILGNGVSSFEDSEDGLQVLLQDQTTLAADFAILAIGVKPDVAFLEGSGIELGPRGHIVVNRHMQTSIPDIYAVGDAVEVTDFVLGARTAIPLAGPANKQGRIAADHIAGLPSRYEGSQGTSIIKIFDTTCASTGLNERTLKQLGAEYHTVHLHPGSHAGYYPGAEPISLKLLFGADGRLFGAQAIGRRGVDKRIDVIAAVQRLGGTVHDLAELELSYAPPYSSAKDPVNMAGFIAGNILDGRLEVVTADQIDTADPSRVLLIDVRSESEHAEGHIPGSIHIPVDQLRDRMDELPKDKELWLYCEVGQRGYIASSILKGHGFDRVKNLSGGYRSYVIANGYRI